jgi:hypothetical protein
MIGTPQSHGLSCTHKIGTVQKWRRVASKSALSQGDIRRNRIASFVSSHNTTASFRTTLFDAETRSVQRIAGGNFRHRRHPPVEGHMVRWNALELSASQPTRRCDSPFGECRDKKSAEPAQFADKDCRAFSLGRMVWSAERVTRSAGSLGSESVSGVSLRPVAFLILLAASTGTGVVAADFIVGAMDRWRRHRFFPTV